MTRGLMFPTALLVTMLSFLMHLGVGQALASHVSCGATITQDTTLDTDLIDCPGDGLSIGADNISLDLNGHTIDGDNVGLFDQGIGNGDFVGTAGYDNVTIQGGSVRDFDIGVFMHEGANENVVRALMTSSNRVGIALQGGDNLVSRSFTSDNAWGIQIAADRNRLRNNSILRNTEYGIFIGFFAGGNRIEGNVVSNNFLGIFLSDAGGGAESSANVIRKNFFSDNFLGMTMIETFNTWIEQNTVLGSNVDGIHVGGESLRNLVEGNLTHQNGDDGIEVEESDNEITRNTANENGDLGIEAVPNVGDGGGNRASGNGNPLQCLNVECR
jgi:parallel beta-helix repeat protein